MNSPEFYLSKLSELGFEFPNLPNDMIGGATVVRIQFQKKLIIDGEPWMGMNLKDYREVFEFYSHLSVTRGKVICTGLGFMLREAWLVKEGHDVTVYERNPDIIRYHQKHNSELVDKVRIINQSAESIDEDCDTLLLDHFELETHEHIVEQVRILSDKISCNRVWFWPLERVILTNSQKNQTTPFQEYQNLRLTIPKLPDLTYQSVDEFCKYWNRDF